MPVLDGTLPELVLVEMAVGLVDVEVASVVEDLVELVVVFDEEDEEAFVEVELGLDVSAPGTHWPGKVSNRQRCDCETYCSTGWSIDTRSQIHRKSCLSKLHDRQHLMHLVYISLFCQVETHLHHRTVPKPAAVHSQTKQRSQQR